MTSSNGSSFTRRGFLGASTAAAAAAFLAACSGGGAGGKAFKFWNMPWGNATLFPKTDKSIVSGYKSAVSYQQIQWANFTQQFASAIASNTGPAVSSGGGTQAFQYAHQGKIAYADDLLDSWKKTGQYDDFLDGLVDTLKTDDGYAAVPYNLDVRVGWYNKAIMEEAGASVPTTWDEYMATCAALKKIGVYGFGQGSGAGNFTGSHILAAFMINNGGGLFNADKKPEAVTSANIEAMEFILELVKEGYVDPSAATYTSANVQAQWKAGKFGFGWDGAGLPQSAVGDEVAKNLVVAEPLTGPSGQKGGLYFPNNIMMYKNTPSQKESESFLTYYYKNMSVLWTKSTGIGLPPLKSIADTDEFKQNANNVAILEKWQPIFKTWAAPGGTGLFYNIANTVDGTQPMIVFTQAILGGKTDAKSALTTLQTSLEGLMK